MRNRRLLLGLGALALVASTVDHPTATLHLLTHDSGDPSPRRMQAAVNLGVVGVSVLYTWTVRHIAR